MGGDEARAKERGIILDNMKKTVESHTKECNSGEDLGKKIDAGLTDKIKKYIKDYESNKNYYNEKKDDFIKDFNKSKEIEELKRSLYSAPREYESYESKMIRQQNELENTNRQIASEKLVGCLDIIRNDFSTKLNDKIFKIKEDIEREINNYSPDNLKIFLQKIAEKENLKYKLIEYIKNESEILLLISFENSKHFNILLLGKTGVGKSTLINGTFDYDENEKAKTGVGNSITQKFDEYTSDKRKGLRLIDSKGIQMDDYNIKEVFNETKNLIEEKARKGDTDKLIHCIWYCFQCGNLRFENSEKETLTLLMNQYHDNSLPIIIVITQSFDEGPTKEMTEFIKKEFQFLKREMIIMPVVAKEKIIINRKNELIIEKDGIEDLLKISFEKSQNAVLPALFKSIEEKIIQSFFKKVENKKRKLKNDLNKICKKILKRIKEEDDIGKSISKLSITIKKTLNIFLKIDINDENENIDNIENDEELNDQEEEEAKENIEIRNEEKINEKNEEPKDNEENNDNIENQNEKELKEINNEEQIQIPEEKIEQNEKEEQIQIPVENLEQNMIVEQIQNEPQDENQEEKKMEKEIIEDDINDENDDEIKISDESKNEINLFLDDLCKWCIGRLTNTIDNLVKENSNELGLLLFNEQTKVKNDNNVKTSLYNEKTINTYFVETEHELKPLITNKVHFLAIKQIFKIIYENLVEASGEIMKEQFNTIIPELNNYISKDKLKEKSNEILSEILKNKEI